MRRTIRRRQGATATEPNRNQSKRGKRSKTATQHATKRKQRNHNANITTTTPTQNSTVALSNQQRPRENHTPRRRACPMLGTVYVPLVHGKRNRAEHCLGNPALLQINMQPKRQQFIEESPLSLSVLLCRGATNKNATWSLGRDRHLIRELRPKNGKNNLLNYKHLRHASKQTKHGKNNNTYIKQPD